MDEDIDIEEHDVLDNPKIRDIFPDLSLVKIEAPDENIQDQYGVQEFETDMNHAYNIKNEVLSDDENDFISLSYGENGDTESNTCQYVEAENVFDRSHHESAYKQNDTICNYEQSVNQNTIGFKKINEYSLRNKIILGSKPMQCLDYDTLYAEALESRVAVALEDWHIKLSNSPCYCRSCEILFPTVNALDAHKSARHSLLIALETSKQNTARKSTTKSTFCNHCNKTFPNDNALIKHLYELLPLNKYQERTSAVIKTETDPNTRYKCSTCPEIFLTLSEVKEHRDRCHPNLKNTHMIMCQKLEIKPTIHTDAEPKIVENKVKKSKLFASTSLVPKSVIFQCHICLVGFLSCFSASQHAKTCENKTEYRQCNICKRKMRSTDFDVHLLQHKYNDKLRIYTLNKQIYEKVIMKCPTCNVCFDEKFFWCYHKTCNGEKLPNGHCNICNIDITLAKYATHKTKHVLKKFTKKDFIIIELYDLNEVEKNKKADDRRLYYCETCRSCKTVRSERGHGKSTCKNYIIKYCSICGLGFTKQYYGIHRMIHDKIDLTIKDFEIISLQSGKIVDPSIPEFHRCHKCQVHYLFKKNVVKHNCRKETFETCKYCNKKFNIKAYNPHIKFHEFKGDTDMPNLLKVYHSINSVWNIVYMCVNCNIVTSSYDAAVEHSQNHICGNQKPLHRKCEICCFDISDKDYRTHMSLHENNSSISRKQFTILKFNYKDMFKKKWMDMFLPLPKQHKYQILAKSIYRCTRRFKLNCEINCSTDDTKFYCKNCKISVNIEDIKKHYFDQQCKYSSKYVCSSCKMTFKNLHECVTHENKHVNVNKLYKVYTFNDKNDDEFNQKLLDFDCGSIKTTTNQPMTVSPKTAVKKYLRKPQNKMADGRNKMAVLGGKRNMAVTKSQHFKIYKCRKCQSCVCLQKNVMSHKCSSRRKGKCHVCNNYFFSRNLSSHISMHRYYGKKPMITYFEPHNPKSMVNAVLYKCDCGLHFTSRSSVDNHLTVCNDSADISKEVCSKCNLLFPTDVLVTHLCKHHIKSVNVNIEIVNVSKKGLFECANCASVYSNMSNFDYHLFDCPLKNGKTCKKYNVNISLKDKHKCTPEVTATVIKKSISTTRLFKCVSCNLHYFAKKGLKYHIDQNHVCHRRIVACNICKLRFTEQVINKHMELHATEQYYMIKIIDSIGRQRIVKGQNMKTNATSSRKRNLVDLEDLNDDTSKIEEDRALDSIKKQNIGTEERDTKPVKRNTADENIANDQQLIIDDLICPVREVYRCDLCNICYVYRKNWLYHIEVNHVNKRGIKTCEICGLTFISSALAKHSLMHQGWKNYLIKVIEPNTSKTTFLKGMNTIGDSKGDAASEYGPVRKKVRINYDESVYFTDDNQEPSTSKDYFESIHMTDEESKSAYESDICVNDYDNEKDPLTDPPESISSDVIEIDKDNADQTVISLKMKSILNANCGSYNNILYRCELCRIHFLTVNATHSHFKRVSRHKPSGKFKKCNLCGLNFTTLTLIRHIYIHHRKMKINRDSFKIIPVFSASDVDRSQTSRNTVKYTVETESAQVNRDIDDEDMNDIDVDDHIQNNISAKSSKGSREVRSAKDHQGKCDNNINDITNNIKNIIEPRDIQKNEDIEDAATHDIKENITSLHTEESIVEDIQKDNHIDDINMKDVDNTKLDKDKNEQNTKIHYHKCGDCNVCFIDEDTCRKHCKSHVLLDAKTYIECKICNFQFMIDSLKDHVTIQHEMEFHLEDLMITEYTPAKDNCLKIGTYRGTDKLQSRLISTTSDLSNTETDLVLDT